LNPVVVVVFQWLNEGASDYTFHPRIEMNKLTFNYFFENKKYIRLSNQYKSVDFEKRMNTYLKIIMIEKLIKITLRDVYS
jgi:hypothetical protein